MNVAARVPEAGPPEAGRPEAGRPARRRARVNVPTVTLAHGGGGKAMRDLIDDVFLGAFDEHGLAPLEDQARLSLEGGLAPGERLALTTDSYVVDPLFFPGGDIGRLAVYGTVNDLAVGGATPLYLTCSAIIEEGLAVDTLRRVARSMAEAATLCGVRIVTGDTKVVPRGACDKLYLNTAGVGVLRTGISLGVDAARPGDRVLVNGVLGDHGAAILNARGDMALSSPIESDCAPLHGLIAGLLAAVPTVRFMRDLTRGGLATVLNEAAEASAVGIEIDEAATPIREEVNGFCDILGFDPLYLANEGRIACVVPEEDAEVALAALRAHEHGAGAAIIGRITERPAGRVVMRTRFGGRRIVDMLVGDQLPRIC
ncbi:MAG: hydrogenase expression/formation protein HypE [Alphaproteobacteria bacterium]|nr:hydrogenase expression/formation protein HypE [Alphaproteobacteria bacterium]